MIDISYLFGVTVLVEVVFRKTVVGEPFTMIDFHKANSLSFCLQKSSVADDLQELLWTLIQSVN